MLQYCCVTFRHYCISALALGDRAKATDSHAGDPPLCLLLSTERAQQKQPISYTQLPREREKQLAERNAGNELTRKIDCEPEGA